MSGEIKEILDNLKDIDKTSILKNNEAKIILDYITNLQQIEQEHQKLNGELREENKRLKEENERLNAQIDAMRSLSKKDYKEIYECLEDFEDGEEHFELPNTIQELEDYKSRNEKAIEYIKDNLYYLVDNDDKNLLNILNGGDKDAKD